SLLLLQHHGESGAAAAVNQVCGDGQTSGCETVAQSRWSKVGGVPLAAFGLVFYLSLAVLLVHTGVAGSATPRGGLVAPVPLALALAPAAEVLLLGVQAIAIKSFCKLCLATYVVNALVLALLWPARGAAATVPSAAASSEGRTALASWLVASLAFMSAVWALDHN